MRQGGGQSAASYLGGAETRAYAAEAQDDIRRWLDRPVPSSVAEAGEDTRFDDDGEACEPMVRRTRFKVSDLWEVCLGNTRSPNSMETTTLGIAAGLVPGWRKEKRRFDGERKFWLTREGSEWGSGWEPVPEADPDLG